MESQKISARVELDDYSNKILSMVKAKYGLKDKSQAINKFVMIYGDEILEREASEEYAKKIIEITNQHFKKYGNKKMSLQELNNLCEM
nr:hypothetical protein [uncultured archaeon]